LPLGGDRIMELRHFPCLKLAYSFANIKSGVL
jgi:hypothetical protein